MQLLLFVITKVLGARGTEGKLIYIGKSILQHSEKGSRAFKQAEGILF